MKALLKLSILTLLFALIFTGCEDDPLQPDKNAMRISKIADNISMNDPDIEFTYDEKGFLIEIKLGGQETPIYIMYDENDRPIEMVTDSDPMCCGDMDTKIEFIWNENSFTKTEYFENELESTTIYDLDSKGRVIGISEDGTEIFDIQWDGDFRVDVNLSRDETWGETIQYNEYHNPLSAINIAILNTNELNYFGTEFDNVYQNKYCMSIFQEWSFDGDEFIYEYNEDGYPIKANKNNSEYGLYFEYEND